MVKKLVFGAFLLLLTGCATPMKMALQRQTERLELAGNSLLLMHLRLRNEHTPDYPPRPFYMSIEAPGADEKSEKLNYVFDTDGVVTTSEAGDFLLRMSVPPGDWIIQGVVGMSHSYIAPGNFFMPLRAPIHVEQQAEIVYLGRVEGTMRTRDAGEFRAGSLIQPLDQQVIGYADATFEVTISDAFEEDMALMRRYFPALTGATVERRVLPAFDREQAQRLWELGE